MRILQIINNLGSGGAEKLLAEFVPLMQSKGYNIDVLLLRRDGSLYIDDLLQAGIKMHILSEKSLYSPKFVFLISKILQKENYDIVHVHLFPSLYWVSVASLFVSRNSNLIFTEHSTNNRRMKSKIFNILDKLIYKPYDKVIGITDQVTSAISDYLGGDKLKFVTIENGININKYTDNTIPDHLPFKFEESECIITMIGRFTEAKDQNTLINALALLSGEPKLLLIGEGPLMIDSKNLVRSLGLDSQVFFLGIRRDIPSILNITTVAVQSSHWEGFGLAAVESMAAGKPLIASNVDGLSSIVKGAGLLFEHENAQELASHINSLLSDEQYYKRIANACKERSKKYSIEKMVDQYLDLYKEVLNEK